MQYKTKIPTYRAMPLTRRTAVIDFFRHRVLRLPDKPMPFFSFSRSDAGFDFEYTGNIPAPSPLQDLAEAQAAAAAWCAAQNAAWRKLISNDWDAKEAVLDLFPPYLELADCYPVYHELHLDWVLYWQVNYRVMLPSVTLSTSGQRVAYKAAVQGESIGIYHAEAARTLQYHHFAVEELGREPYFFAPKMTEQHTVTPAADAQAVAKGSAPATPQNPTKEEVTDDFDHNALFYKRVGDAYAPFAVTPQGAVAASKSGVVDKEGEDVLLCKIENNGIYVCGVYKKKTYTYRLTADLISKGIPEAGINFNKALKLCYSTPLGQSLFDKYINGDGMIDGYELKYDDGTISQKRLEHSTIVYVLHQTVMEFTGSSGSTKTYIQKDTHFWYLHDKIRERLV